MALHRGSFSVFSAALSAALLAAAGAAANPAAGADLPPPPTVVFNRDIRPIFSDKCYACHGPDEANRKTALRFDRPESAFAPLPADGFPTVMVMAEMDPPRQTRMLKRGAHDAPGESVTAAVPSLLPPLPAGLPNNRLGLARWLVDRENPSTARVTVNRFWQMLFGSGLVASVENFGSQGEWPTHPEVLDWLAVEFMESGWDVKSILKVIVTSATYRQSSKLTPELIEKDAKNRLPARGPRLRLAAESVRDQALALSGLLTEQQGGPSVRPYQPAGLWKELSNWDAYEHDGGDRLYRRGLYTFWKRTIAPPGDADFRRLGPRNLHRPRDPYQHAIAGAESDERRDLTSKPLASRPNASCGKAGRAPSSGRRTVFASRRPAGPPPRNRKSCREASGDIVIAYQTAPEDARSYLSVGESRRDETIDPVELAAYAAVASLILNLDETITKE